MKTVISREIEHRFEIGAVVVKRHEESVERKIVGVILDCNQDPCYLCEFRDPSDSALVRRPLRIDYVDHAYDEKS